MATREQRQGKGQLSSAGIYAIKQLVEYLKPYELSASQRMTTYQLMLTDDAVAAAFASRSMAIEKAQSRGRVVSSGTPLGDQLADFIEYNLASLDGQTVRAIGRSCSEMIVNGWSPHEMVFQSIKQGEEFYGDFQFRLKKLAYIHPLTLDQTIPFETDDKGDSIVLLRQHNRAFNSQNGNLSNYSHTSLAGVKEIPFNRVCYTSYSSTMSQPLGMSILDAIYTVWREKQFLQEITLSGISKDLAGVPVIKIPQYILDEAAIEPDGAAAMTVEAITMGMTNLAQGEDAFVMIPSDSHGENGAGSSQYQLELLGVQGGKNFDVRDIIDQRRRAIFVGMGTPQLAVGETSAGSYNLHEGQAGAEAHFVERDCMLIEEMYNKQIIPKLLKLNGVKYSYKDLPKWISGQVQPVSMDEYGKFVNRTARLLPANAQVVNKILERMEVDYRVDDNATPEDIRETLFEFSEPSKVGTGGGSSGTGDSQSGGSQSDSNSENAS